jgi:PAS domain-containing protein
VVRRLASRAAWQALRVLISGLDAGTEMILIDARGCALSPFDDETREIGVPGAAAARVDHDPERMAEMRRLMRQNALSAEFALDWVSADSRRVGPDGREIRIHGYEHRETRQWLGFWQWCDLRDAWVALGMAAFDAAPVPEFEAV